MASVAAIIATNYGEEVDLFIIDDGLPWDVIHPFHLHGFNFKVSYIEIHVLNRLKLQVLAMERLGASPEHLYGKNGPGNNITRQMVIDRDMAGQIPRNLISPPMKDTAVIPDAGYTLVRIQANNPGVWLMHCHMSWHNAIGMGVVFRVGRQQDWPDMPSNFPQCGDFV